MKSFSISIQGMLVICDIQIQKNYFDAEPNHIADETG